MFLEFVHTSSGQAVLANQRLPFPSKFYILLCVTELVEHYHQLTRVFWRRKDIEESLLNINTFVWHLSLVKCIPWSNIYSLANIIYHDLKIKIEMLYHDMKIPCFAMFALTNKLYNERFEQIFPYL